MEPRCGVRPYHAPVATIRSVESQIQRLEGFAVRIRHGRDGRDVRSDKAKIPGYDYQRQLDGAKTVRQWRDGRFRRRYPGFEVDVIRADGHVAHGGTLLATLRKASD